MTRSLLLLLCLLNAAASVAQLAFGNEWVDHGRRHWRFSVVEEGIHRIDSTTLANAGFPVGMVDPADLMLFGRQQQVPIHVEGGEDGVLNANDYIEFYATGNDGWLDQQMYPNPAHMPNPYYSLYNDTIRYYLTWDPDAPKLRIATYNNTGYAAHVIRPWAWGETLITYNQAYYPGLGDPQFGASSGFMTEGEGWMRQPALLANSTNNGVEQSITVTTPRSFSGAGAPPMRVTTSLASINNPGGAGCADHHLILSYGPAPGQVVMDTIYTGVKVLRNNFEVPQSLIANNLIVRFTVPYDLFAVGQVGTCNPTNYTDRQSVAFVRVKYPRDFGFQNTNFRKVWVPEDPADPIAHLDFGNFTGTPLMYAWGDTLRRIFPTPAGNRWKALVPTLGAGEETQVVVQSQQSIINITQLQQVNGTGFFTDYAALEADSALLIVAHASLMPGAMQYKNYRENLAPVQPINRRMPTVVVDVDELYDQFGGGVPKNAFAIRRFARYVVNTWETDPRGLILMGKSVQTATYAGSVGYRSNGTAAQAANSQAAYNLCLVPSYGHPSSDPCFTLGLRFDTRVLDIPVGRISATNNNQVLAYLGKVNNFEYQPPAAWMKNILHFRGGFTQNENILFGVYMNGFKAIAQDSAFGGRVVDFVKTTSDIFQQAAADSVRHFIEEEGVTIMNFFAHAYSQNFDITIDNPTNYNWNGKHPLVIGNSCYIGNVHLNNTNSTGEQWVLMPDKGPIGFLSTVDLGFATKLSQYTNSFYRSFSQVNYGRGIGDHMRHACFEQLSFSNDLMGINNSHTFTLQGDPTLVLNSWPKPDYVISEPDISYNPGIVTADADSFQVKVAVTNIGKAIAAEFNVALDRTAPELSGVQNYLTTLNNVYYRDTAVFTVPTLAFSGGQGINSLEVRVDLDPQQVDELENVSNNIVTTELFISSGDLVPVYPYDFAIVPDPTPILKASTGNPLAPVRNYIFQIDTTDLFNSPVRESTMISAPGGVVTWQPTSIYSLNSVQDSTVFYWRCSIDSAGNAGYNWYERSFQYITNEHGWGQAHYFQFKNNNYNGIVYDRPDREFEFFSGQRNLRADVVGSVSNDNTGWFLDLLPKDYNGCSASPAWHVVVIDPASFTPWGTYWVSAGGTVFNPDHQFGNQNNGSACRNRVEEHFIFRTTVPSELEGMRNMIQNVVPDGHHMMLYTWLYLDKAGMAANSPLLMPAMEALGVPSFNALPDSVPYIFYVRKGDPGTFADTVGTSATSVISGSFWIDGFTRQGTIKTMMAGPASEWHALYWDETPRAPTDSTRIKLYGITDNNDEVPLLDLPSTQNSVLDLGAQVSAAQYPRLRIEGQFFDLYSPDPEPAQIHRWQLLSSPVPECAINPPLGYANGLENLFRGQEASLAVAVQNISEFDMDSLLMGAWVIDRNNVRHLVHYKLKQPLPAGEFVIDTIRFNTQQFGGANTLIVEANPVDTVTGIFHQREQYRFNNILQIRFAVEIDVENPLLDVTFDGMHILDGDIVSARPEIEITLNDENPFLLLDSPADTANFKVFLTRPGQALERIYFRDGMGVENMQFIPASGPENISRILYRPIFNADGKYMITVQASDQSNNVSGDQDYRVNFEVINRPTITEVLNYPNPFTTNTRFVFTVTGVEPPTYMKIQILTVTGRVVREVKMHEIGPIRVGRNMTEFAWDGTDEFGDRLARGVYLYRVIAQLHGQEIEYRETGASQFFNKGFGKMYLLR
jgi:hypothetical protein